MFVTPAFAQDAAAPATGGFADILIQLMPVSYTHLTLPTICSV